MASAFRDGSGLAANLAPGAAVPGDPKPVAPAAPTRRLLVSGKATEHRGATEHTLGGCWGQGEA